MAKELLQDITIRSSKPKEKDYRLSDGDGLYILIKTTMLKTEATNRRLISKYTAHIGSRKILSDVKQVILGYGC